MVCRVCGQHVPAAAVFCPQCGQATITSDDTQVRPQPLAEPPLFLPPTRSAPVPGWAIAGGALVALAVLVGGGLLIRPMLESTATQFLDGLAPAASPAATATAPSARPAASAQPARTSAPPPSQAAPTTAPGVTSAPAAPASRATTTVPATQLSFPDVWVPAGSKECQRSGTGPWAAVGTQNATTSCPFAINVRTAYLASGLNGRAGQVGAYSPTTKLDYVMSCSGDQPVVCVGGKAGRVVIYGGRLRIQG